MTTIDVVEGAITLRLDSERCLKWDGHKAFRDGVQRLGLTKAVDVCASVDGEGAVLIELKDFRAAAIENRTRMTSGELAREVAEKVRDTLAGMVWACRRGLSESFHEALTAEFLERKKMFVVLWLETDHMDIAGASTLQDAIRMELRPHILAKVTVTSTLIEKSAKEPLAWLRARGLPSARLAKR